MRLSACSADVIAPAAAQSECEMARLEVLFADQTGSGRLSRALGGDLYGRQARGLASLGSAGFDVGSARTRRLRMDFPTWTAWMHTPEPHARVIRSLQEVADSDVHRHFAIEPDGSFLLEVMMIEAVAT
jgi:hypothetical protein